MDRFLVLFSFLIASVFCYETMNDANTAYESCQDVLIKDPAAVDGLYYINNHGEVEPYLTLCLMSVNKGGWTLFYKNNNVEAEGSSYDELLAGSHGFIEKGEDIESTSVVGVSPVEGLKPVSIMAMVVNDPTHAYSAVEFNDVDIAESIINISDLVQGCNPYETNFKNKPDFTFTEFGYFNGTFSFRTCDETVAEEPENIWLGDVFATDSNRVLSCGGLSGNHCMYFVREALTYDLDPELCMCRASGVDNMIWPATACGTSRTIACFEGADNGVLTRMCDSTGHWEDFIQGNCTCTGVTEFKTEWPTTAAGETAHVACKNDVTRTRDRLCLPNGEWDNMMTGGCECAAQKFMDVQWEATEGDKTAEHLCAKGSEGKPYQRHCNMDGSWSPVISGSCSCPSDMFHGTQWNAAQPGETQTVECDAASVGTTMSRTCGRYGSWYPIEGNCDCPQESVNNMLWPQTNAGTTAKISCVAGAVGTPSTRVCSATGTWGEITEGACSCPAGTWKNYAGTEYQFSQTAAGETVILPCASGEGSLTRVCQQYGAWSEPEGCPEAVYCPAETINGLTFEETLGGSTAMIMCHSNNAMSYGRLCKQNGEWEPIVGYCMCSQETDEYGNVWADTRSGEEVTMTCLEGYSGQIVRECSPLGDWIYKSGECTRNQCVNDQAMNMEWPLTDSLNSVTLSCESGLGEGFTRNCMANGEWSEAQGSCACPATTIEGIQYPQSAAETVITMQCPEHYVGTITRKCSITGTWNELVNDCQPVTCPAESFDGFEWPSTMSGQKAEIMCPDAMDGSHTRLCKEDGTWSSVVSGKGCYCAPTTVEENGVYFFGRTAPEVTVTKACAPQYSGIIQYTCSRSGEWTNLVNECQHIQCPGEMMDGIYYEATNSNTTRTIPCAQGAIGSGYQRYCDVNGVWSETVVGECKCPAEQLRHTDGHLYEFEETSAGTVINQICGGDLSGSISRTCSLYGGWYDINGECKRLQCPQETIDNYEWPLTDSSTTVELPCKNFMSGSMTRVCHAAGVWSDPVDNCHIQVCEPVTIKRLGNGCMNLKFEPPAGSPYVKMTVVPSSSPDMSIVFRGQTVRVCGLDANVAYSMFVQYCTDETSGECSNSCKLDNVYYQQSCEIMKEVDIIDVKEVEVGRELSISAKFPVCPMAADSLELHYQCVENCSEEEEEERVIITKCTSLNGCMAGERATIKIEDVFSKTAVYEFKQRMRLVDGFSDLQSFSPIRRFTIADLTRPAEVTTSVNYLNSKTVRLTLEGVDNGLILYKKHIIYIYKKLTGTRRLVDSLFSTVTLCPVGNTVCEETYTDIVVEPGYTYTFSVYSYPIIADGKVSVAINNKDILIAPYYTVKATPGDYFIRLELNDAEYPLAGSCFFVAQSTTNNAQTLVNVELPAHTSTIVTGNNLVVDSPYMITCNLQDELGTESRVTVTSHTLPIIPPQLTITYVADTTYDVTINAVTNKPSTMYCLVSDLDKVPSLQELLLYGFITDLTEANTDYEVNLLLDKAYTTDYHVTCAAIDLFARSELHTLVITPSGTPYAPELISTTPALDAMNVAPYIQMELVFKYPVTINTCQFCFFILYNTKDHTSTSLYASAFTVTDNVISFTSRQLESLTTYELRASTRGLITDKATGIEFVPVDDILLRFTTKSYENVDGGIVYPTNTVFPVNGVIHAQFTNYLYLNQGQITINAMTIDASNKCLQIQHDSEMVTSLFIHVEDCIGQLRTNSSYVLTIPQAFLVTREHIESPRITQVFTTDLTSYPPRVIEAFPYYDSVPIDVPISLGFNQPVVFGDGYLFIAEYINDKYVNSYNVPASKATFTDSYPFTVTWDATLFSFKPTRRYVMSWSEGMVKNYNGQLIAASTSDETIEFETEISACSPDYIADQITDTFNCVYEEGKCVCRTWNVLAVDQKKH